MDEHLVVVLDLVCRITRIQEDKRIAKIQLHIRTDLHVEDIASEPEEYRDGSSLIVTQLPATDGCCCILVGIASESGGQDKLRAESVAASHVDTVGSVHPFIEGISCREVH